MKPVMTGISCMALVAVLATWSLGDGADGPGEERSVEVFVEAVAPEVININGESGELIIEEIAGLQDQIGEIRTGVATVVADGVEQSADVDIQIAGSDAGSKPRVLRLKTVKGIPSGSAQSTAVTRTISVVGGVTNDEVRKALEKVAGELTEKAEALEREGQSEQAQSKQRAVTAIRELLKGPQAGTVIATDGAPHRFDVLISSPGTTQVSRQVHTRIAGNGPEFVELRELTAKLEALRAEAGKLTDDSQSEARKEVASRVEQLEKQLAEKREKLKAIALVRTGMPVPPVPPVPPVAPGAPRHEVFELAIHGPGQAEAQSLRSQAEALLKASQALKVAGKHAEAKALMAESEELKAKAEKSAARVVTHLAPHPHGDFLFVGGAPGAAGGELHTAVKELQEQVQLLRKEVGELKELLKK